MGRAFEYRRAAKEKRWGHMSRMFPKLAKQITAAAKEGGMDPDMNPKLRTAIQNAKAENMPKDNPLSWGLCDPKKELHFAAPPGGSQSPLNLLEKQRT